MPSAVKRRDRDWWRKEAERFVEGTLDMAPVVTLLTNWLERAYEEGRKVGREEAEREGWDAE